MQSNFVVVGSGVFKGRQARHLPLAPSTCFARKILIFGKKQCRVSFWCRNLYWGLGCCPA